MRAPSRLPWNLFSKWKKNTCSACFSSTYCRSSTLSNRRDAQEANAADPGARAALAEAIKKPAQRQGLPADDWVVAAAELKFRADDEAEAFEEAERKRRQEAHRRAEEYRARNEPYTSDPGDPRKLCETAGFKAVAVGC